MRPETAAEQRERMFRFAFPGEPLPKWDDVAQEAQVTEADKAIAPRFWQHYGTPLFRRLLAAIREDR